MATIWKSIGREIDKVNSEAGGATLTKESRATTLGHVFNTLRNDLNLQVKSLENLKTSQITSYVRHELANGKGLRSLQNDLTNIRTGLAALGREQFAKSDQNSNKAMGIDGASRDGTHKAVTAEQYRDAIASMRARDPGAAAALQLQRELGLRCREAVQSVQSLAKWGKQIERGQNVSVIHGTKGGRSRETASVNRERALDAIREARAAAKENGGQLVRSASLQGAMRAYGRHCEAVGLKGENASHALRCAYAQERFAQHLEQCGGDRREALAATSLDLGHGDGRGTYVAQVYLR